MNATILADFGLIHDGTTFRDELLKLKHDVKYFLIPETHHQSVSTCSTTIQKMTEFIKETLDPKARQQIETVQPTTEEKQCSLFKQ